MDLNECVCVNNIGMMTLPRHNKIYSLVTSVSILCGRCFALQHIACDHCTSYHIIRLNKDFLLTTLSLYVYWYVHLHLACCIICVLYSQKPPLNLTLETPLVSHCQRRIPEGRVYSLHLPEEKVSWRYWGEYFLSVLELI